MLEDLIREFNNSFEGDAQIVIRNGTLEITVLSRTLIITLPKAIGWQATAELDEICVDATSYSRIEANIRA